MTNQEEVERKGGNTIMKESSIFVYYERQIHDLQTFLFG
jgi:hypothetical protein